MSAGFGEVPSWTPQRPSTSDDNSANNGDAGNFECNICFDLAQDPIVTLCGHLFCWPCLYKWLHIHSHSQECPVCKALIEEEKLVPLYGRGKNSTDPRSKSVPDVEIPHRPAGQRPETAPPPDRNAFGQPGFGLMGGFGPAMTASFGNFTFSFGGLFPSFFNLQMHAFSGHPLYGNGAPPPMQAPPPTTPTHGFNFGGHHHHYRVPQQRTHHQEIGSTTASTLLIIGLLFLLLLLWN
uniref:E3 ubiquitin-protein ligase RNF185-like n=1 Tax=Erigeron canadensis TaxID=72917 RepID=UPI001CB919AF|nr:E3 ubiquitin-protein ligase RNF185-like [Erigeron canadensis]